MSQVYRNSEAPQFGSIRPGHTAVMSGREPGLPSSPGELLKPRNTTTASTGVHCLLIAYCVLGILDTPSLLYTRGNRLEEPK